ncbi:hypothetical protein H5410_060875 [Solanum commersonii]|uniref:Uncharacterized protein n=1 Tax=Solanum commersonii TaxID=4109 RepID=A0A9J5W681_SOLCO|nr:hypothetical protein H5410_060875 [Solanum commersonii]
MFSSRIAIYSSSVSAYDSSTAASSLGTSSVVVGRISEVSGASKSSAASSNEVKSLDFKYSTSFLKSSTLAFKARISEVSPSCSHKLQLS